MVLHFFGRVLCPVAPEQLALRAYVDIAFCVKGKLLGAVVVSLVFPVRQGHVGANVFALQGGDVLECAVGGVARDLVRPKLEAETDMPGQVEHGLILHDLARCDQDAQDDAACAAVHHIMRLVVVGQAVLRSKWSIEA